MKEFKLAYKDGKSMPTFYIYLMDESDYPVCYFRDSVLNYMDKHAPVQWKPFEPDGSIGTVTN